MPGQFSSATFQELQNAVQMAIAWLTHTNPQVMSTRFGRYAADLAAVVQAYQSSDFSQVKEGGIRIATALFEAQDLLEIHRAFRNGRFSSEIGAQLTKIAKGPASFVDENPASSSNAARNFAFELLVAGRIGAGGSEPFFPRYADVGMHAGGTELAIQCKRPWTASDDAVEKKFQEAQRDLKQAIRQGAKGIVAIDLSRTLNPQFSIPELRDQKEIRRTMLQASRAVVDNIAPTLRAARPGVIGLITRNSTLIYEGSSKLWTPCQQYGLTRLPSATDEEHQALSQLDGVLAAAAAADSKRLSAD